MRMQTFKTNYLIVSACSRAFIETTVYKHILNINIQVCEL